MLGSDAQFTIAALGSHLQPLIQYLRRIDSRPAIVRFPVVLIGSAGSPFGGCLIQMCCLENRSTLLSTWAALISRNALKGSDVPANEDDWFVHDVPADKGT